MLDFTDVMVSDIMHLTCVNSEVKRFCGNTGNVDQDTCFLIFCWLHESEGKKRLSFQDVRSRKSMTDHAYHAEKPRLSNLRPRGIHQECENRI